MILRVTHGKEIGGLWLLSLTFLCIVFISACNNSNLDPKVECVQKLNNGTNTVKLKANTGYLVCGIADFNWQIIKEPGGIDASLEDERNAFSRLPISIKSQDLTPWIIYTFTSSPVLMSNLEIAACKAAFWSNRSQNVDLELTWGVDKNASLSGLQFVLTELGDTPFENRGRDLLCATHDLRDGTKLVRSDFVRNLFPSEEPSRVLPVPLIQNIEGLKLRKSVMKGQIFKPEDLELPSGESGFKAFLERKEAALGPLTILKVGSRKF